MHVEQVLLAGDSIIQRIGNWRQSNRHTEYQIHTSCLRGCTTARLAKKIERNRIDISPYDKIVVHIGTNNIRTRSWRHIRLDFIELLGIMQVNNPTAVIIFSLPLPRPCNMETSWPRQDMLNKWLIKHQSRGNYKIWRTYKTFLQKRSRVEEIPQIKSNLDYRHDGLHLSHSGSTIMQQLKMVISLIN